MMTEAEKTQLINRAYDRIMLGDPTEERWRMTIDGVVTEGPVHHQVDTRTVLRDLVDECTK